MNLEITNKLEKIVLSSIYSFILIYVFKDFITYKIAYAFQFLILIYLIFNLNYFKLNKLIIFLNLPLIFILFFEFDKSYIYLITLAFLNSLLLINNKDLNVIIKKKNILIFIFFYFLFLVAATDNQTFLLQDIIRALYHFHYFGYKYGFLDLNPSYTAIIFTSVALLYVKKLNNKEFYYYIFLLIISIITIFGSKVALLFTIVCFLSSLKFVNKKLLISTFVLINLVVFFLGYLTIKKLPNPYIHSEYYGKKEKFENYKNSQDQITDYYYIQAQTYDEIICPNIKSDLIKIFATCPKDDTELLNQYGWSLHALLNRFKFLGYSSYYKFYSIGYTSNFILENYKLFLFPTPLKNLKEKKIINKYIISSHLAAHNLPLGVFLKLGIIFGIFFFINFFYLMTKVNDKIILSFFISTSMLTVDVLIFLPIILLHIFVKDNKYSLIENKSE